MSCSVKKRYILVALIHYATFCLYSLRVNLSVAIVSMVNQTYANTKKTSIKECGGDSSNSTMNVSSQVSFLQDIFKIFQAKTTDAVNVFFFFLSQTASANHVDNAMSLFSFSALLLVTALDKTFIPIHNSPKYQKNLNILRIFKI